MRGIVGVRVVLIIAGLMMFLGSVSPPAAAFIPALAPYAEAGGGIPNDVAIDGNYAYVAAASALVILDISTPSDPQVVGSVALPGIVKGVALYGECAFVACDMDGLRVVDVSDPAHPTEVAHLDMTARSVTVHTWYAYVACGTDGLTIVNIGTPTAPVVEGHLALPGYSSQVAVMVNYAYVAAGTSGMRRVDITDKANPLESGYYNIGGYNHLGVAASGQYVYAATMGGGLKIILSQPGSISLVKDYAAGQSFTGVACSAGVVYATTYFSLRLIDVSDPANPFDISEISLAPGPQRVALYGDYAYVAALHGGVRVISVADTASPEEVGSFDPPGGALGAVSHGNHIYVASAGAGVRVMEVGAGTATQVGSWRTGGWAYGVALGGNYLYLADGSNGLAIANISDAHSPAEVGSIYDAPGEAVAVTVAGGYAYVANNSTGLRVFNVSNPAAPTLAGSCAVTGSAVDVAVSGNYAYVAAGTGGLRIIDISSPTAPTEVAFFYGGALYYTGGVALSGHYAYLADGNRALRILDISDPLHPAQVSLTFMDLVTTNVLDVDVSGRYAYIAGYLGGLRVYDIADPAHPVEVAYGPTFGSSLQKVTASDGFICMSVYGWGVYVFTPPPGNVSGQVREAGTVTNIVGATVKCIGVRVSKQATSNASGIYQITGIPAGTCSVTASAPGYLSQTKAGIVVVAQQTTYVNFNLPASGRLTGQVRDRATSANLAGATVSIYRGAKLITTRTTAFTGIYSYNTDLSTGTYSLIASKNGYVAQAKAKISVTEGQTTYVNFSLDRVCLKGQVRAASNGASLAGATVTAVQGHLKVTATTDRNGIYEIGGLAAGSCTVTAVMAGYVRQTKGNITITDGVITYVNFNLPTSGKLRGQVNDKVAGTPIIGATITARMGGVVRATGTTTSPWGIYDIGSDLPEGTYSLNASATGYIDQGKINITVTAGATTYVNFNLQPQ